MRPMGGNPGTRRMRLDEICHNTHYQEEQARDE